MNTLGFTRIYVARHGQTDFNQEDKIQGSSDCSPSNDINERGIAEATALAKKLNLIAFDQVFSSDLKRAVQTCKIITGGKDPTTIDTRIRERDYGLWEGRLWEEFRRNEAENWKQVESDTSVRERALAFFEEIGQKYKGQTVLVVTHGGLMRNVLIRIFNLDCKVEDIKAGNASYFTLEYSDKWELGPERDGLEFPGESLALSLQAI